MAAFAPCAGGPAPAGAPGADRREISTCKSSPATRELCRSGAGPPRTRRRARLAPRHAADGVADDPAAAASGPEQDAVVVDQKAWEEFAAVAAAAAASASPSTADGGVEFGYEETDDDDDDEGSVLGLGAAKAQARIEMEMEAQRIKSTDVPVPEIDPREFFAMFVSDDYLTMAGVPDDYNPYHDDLEELGIDVPESLAQALGQLRDIDLEPVNPDHFIGTPLLILPVASDDTKAEEQFGQLQDLSQRFGEKLNIMVLPSNVFGQKESRSRGEVKKIYRERYTRGKLYILEVGNPNLNPVFHLGRATFPGQAMWNFQTKFLFGRDGRAAGRFNMASSEDEISEAINECIGG